MSTKLALSSSLGAVWAIAAAAGLGAQPLVDASQCPAGSTFDIRPYGLAGYTGAIPDPPFLRRTINTTAYPEALCNDGSPAVFYLRPAQALPNNPPSSRWFIFFDGGGSCGDADDCFLGRWCSGSSRVFDVAGKMSSRGAWAAIESPRGIFDPTPGPGGVVNGIAHANQVFVLYCSSDTWIGSSVHQGLSTSTGVGYDIQFRGEAIVNAVIDTLLSGPTGADPGTEHVYDENLPSLADATFVLLGAESAGGNGLRHHIDRLHERIDKAVCPQAEDACPLDLRGVIDAAVPPALWDPGIDWSDPASAADYRDYLLTQMEPRVRTFWGADDSALDESCLDPVHSAAHVADGGLHPQVCYDTTYTLEKHITTPMFVRQDINDLLARGKYDTWNLFPVGGTYMAAQYDLLDNLGSSPLEAGFASFDRGVFGNKCDEHVTIQRSRLYFRSRVSGSTYPTAFPFHRLLVNWLGGAPAGPNTRQVQDDNPALPGYNPSICP